jgi:hypothetical protein
MKLENQVVSLDLSRKLKELGVKQESLFSWKPDRPQIPTLTEAEQLATQWKLFDSASGTGDYAAFTVAELGEMLPANIQETNKKILYWKQIREGKTDWYAGVLEELAWVVAGTEADARAKMLIYLLENKLISVK